MERTLQGHLALLIRGGSFCEQKLTTVLTDPNLQTVRLPPFPWHLLPSQPPIQLHRAPHVTKASEDSRSDTARNCLRPVKGGCSLQPSYCCVAIEILSLETRNGSSECICSCGCCQTRSCFASWDGEQSEFRLEAGHLCNQKTFSQAGEKSCGNCSLIPKSPPQNLPANFPLCI